MPRLFICKVCGTKYPSVKLAYQCTRYPVPRRRFVDGDRVRSKVPHRVIPGADPDDNIFAVRGEGEMCERLIADHQKMVHRRQIRVRWLGFTKLSDVPPTFLYEDELERIHVEWLNEVKEKKAVRLNAP